MSAKGPVFDPRFCLFRDLCSKLVNCHHLTTPSYNHWQFPIINSNHNSCEDSLFPSDDELTIIPPPNPCSEPLPPPATPVPNTYCNRMKHEKRAARMVQLTYRERIDHGLVTPTEQKKR
jgi:hypothetical protein